MEVSKVKHISKDEPCPNCKSKKKSAYSSVRLHMNYEDYLVKGSSVSKSLINKASVSLANKKLHDLSVVCRDCGHKFKVVDSNEDTDY